MLYIGVLDVVDLDLLLSYLSCGNNDLLYDLFFLLNYRVVCFFVVFVRNILLVLKKFVNLK